MLYINKYYEVNLTTGNATSYYYLGGRLAAMSENGTLSYTHQDHLGGTALMTSDNGTLISSIDYMPYGETRAGDVPTDKKFTGQRLDDTGLYYYGARYYDPTIGRFISPDTYIQDFTNPQSFNRYSYVLNNPLKYNDPSGNFAFALVLIPLAPIITKALIATAAVVVTTIAANLIVNNIARDDRGKVINVPPPNFTPSKSNPGDVWKNGAPKAPNNWWWIPTAGGVAALVAKEVSREDENGVPQLPMENEPVNTTPPQPATPFTITDDSTNNYQPTPPQPVPQTSEPKPTIDEIKASILAEFAKGNFSKGLVDIWNSLP